MYELSSATATSAADMYSISDVTQQCGTLAGAAGLPHVQAVILQICRGSHHDDRAVWLRQSEECGHWEAGH